MATTADHGGNSSTPPSTASASRIMSRETSSSISSNIHRDIVGTAPGVLLPDVVVGGGRGDRANSLAEPPPCQGRGGGGGDSSSAGAVATNDRATNDRAKAIAAGVVVPPRIIDGGASGSKNNNDDDDDESNHYNGNVVPHSPGVVDPSSSTSSSSVETISYSAERIIGNGSFGVVFQASVVETGEIVAIKKVLQDKRFKNRELQIMRQLVKDGHSNIVGLKHCFYSQVRQRSDCFTFILSAAPCLFHSFVGPGRGT
jgi:hypothetical protein